VDEIFIDTGVFIHLFDYLDRSNTLFTHDSIKDTYNDLLHEGYRFITTTFVISETLNHITNIVNKGNTPYNFDWIFEFYEAYIHKNLSIHLLDSSIIEQALKISKGNPSWRYSFVDASCFAFLEKYGFVKLFTTELNWIYYRYFKGHKFEPVDYVNIFSPSRIT
jgi:predicted nucleic acid-binding protein